MCKGCKAPFRCGSTPGHQGKIYRTLHLQCHKSRCPMLKVHDLDQMFINQEGKRQVRKLISGHNVEYLLTQS